MVATVEIKLVCCAAEQADGMAGELERRRLVTVARADC